MHNGSNTVEKENLLTEHLMDRTGHFRPNSILGLVVVCDRSQLSVTHDSHGLVSIDLLGYVQVKDATPHSVMRKMT